MTNYDVLMNSTEEECCKLLDEKVCIEGMCTVVLRSVYEDGRYVFLTNKQDDKCLEKSPIDMFADTAIDNDLKMVDNTIREYFNITEDKENA